jgi:hypothetical protein
MSFTIEQARTVTAYAKNSLEAGDYVFRVAKVLQKTADRGFNAGKEVIVFVNNPLTDNNDAASFDRSRTLFSEVAVPVYPGEDAATDAAIDEFKKGLRSLAYWAECLGMVESSPPKTGDKKADWAAYEEWAVNAANALCDNPDNAVGKAFGGTITVNDKGYPKLSKKIPLASF